MAFSRAEAFAPASMGNVGIGFDILGMAFAEPGDTVRVERCAEPGATIAAIERDGGLLTHDPAKNTATVAANAFLQHMEIEDGVRITLIKDLPIGSGLGSSASSAVAAAVAINALFEAPLSREDLLAIALEGEAAVSGHHLDNVGPSLLGGILLLDSHHPVLFRRLPVPDNLHLALVTPAVTVPTVEARAVLPVTIPLAAMVRQTAGVAHLVDALYRGDIAAMAAAMESDCVVEPARAHLIPLLAEARRAAHHAGAAGLAISGAGPTLCAVCDDATVAQHVAAALQAVYQDAQIGCTVRVTRVGQEGAQVRLVE
jgi:homoserine kinase